MTWIALLFNAALAANPGDQLPVNELAAQVETSESLEDSPLLVNFWATWCGPCRVDLPLLAELDRELPDVRVVLVSIDAEPRRAEGMLRSMRLDLPVAYDSTGTLSERFAPPALPTTYLLAADGTVLQVYEGIVAAERVRRDVEAL